MTQNRLFVFTTFLDHAEFHSLQGVEVKIGEKFRPPKKVYRVEFDYSIRKIFLRLFM